MSKKQPPEHPLEPTMKGLRDGGNVMDLSRDPATRAVLEQARKEHAAKRAAEEARKTPEQRLQELRELTRQDLIRQLEALYRVIDEMYRSTTRELKTLKSPWDPADHHLEMPPPSDPFLGKEPGTPYYQQREEEAATFYQALAVLHPILAGITNSRVYTETSVYDVIRSVRLPMGEDRTTFLNRTAEVLTSYRRAHGLEKTP